MHLVLFDSNGKNLIVDLQTDITIDMKKLEGTINKLKYFK